MRKSRSRGKLANFDKGDYVLVTRQDFDKGEKLCWRWKRPKRFVRPRSNFVFLVEDLCNGSTEEIHDIRLQSNHDRLLDQRAVLLHVLPSETGMPIARLLRLVEKETGN